MRYEAPPANAALAATSYDLQLPPARSFVDFILVVCFATFATTLGQGSKDALGGFSEGPDEVNRPFDEATQRPLNGDSIRAEHNGI